MFLKSDGSLWGMGQRVMASLAMVSLFQSQQPIIGTNIVASLKADAIVCLSNLTPAYGPLA